MTAEIRIESARSSLPYIPALDGVRAAAVLMVMFYHARWFFGRMPFAPIIQCGWVGVDLFFTLSGFLITRILMDARWKRDYFRNFYLRRARRIWPLYFLLLGGVFFYALATGTAGSVRWWAYVVLVQNLFVPGVGIALLRGTWSLAIEEQFYIVWPLLVRFIGGRGLVTICVSLLAVEPILRYFYLPSHGSLEMYVMTFTHLDGIVSGCLLALCLSFMREQAPRLKWLLWLSIVLGGAGTLLLITRAGALRQQSVMLFSCLSLASGGVVGLCAISAFPFSRVLLLRPVRYVGRISYGLYLLHLPVFDFIGKYWGHRFPAALQLAAEFAVTFCLAALSWHLFERRIIFSCSTPQRE
jgi:peptidoglycan/LPS O-acetylase OafA/YrhL